MLIQIQVHSTWRSATPLLFVEDRMEMRQALIIFFELLTVFLFFFSYFANPLLAQSSGYPTAAYAPSAWQSSDPYRTDTIDLMDGTSIGIILLGTSNPVDSDHGLNFACGFYGTGYILFFAIFIVYTNSSSDITLSPISTPPMVWTANRDYFAHYISLNFTIDGNLLLQDGRDYVFWSSNTPDKSVVRMVLKDEGNLVLLDKRNSTVWDSFDNPTDSLVLGQSLRIGQRLIASTSESNTTQGVLYLTFDSVGMKLFADSVPPQLYYSKPFRSKLTGSNWNNLYLTFKNGSIELPGLFTETGVPEAVFSVRFAEKVPQYMKLEPDGHLKVYEWKEGKGWGVVDDLLDLNMDNCSYPMVCGPYGICRSGECSCPQGADPDRDYFRAIDGRYLNHGCTAVTPLSCDSMEYHGFLSLGDVSYFNYIDTKSAMRGDKDGCLEACSKNCSCKAALFYYRGTNDSDGYCHLPSRVFSLKSDVPSSQNGIMISTAYIKIQLPVPPSSNETWSPTRATSTFRNRIIGSALGAVFLMILVFAMTVLVVRRKKVMQGEEEEHFDQVPGTTRRFSYQELIDATENFCRKLGEGGFGSVFDGSLADGTKIAVKHLNGFSKMEKDFLNEVQIIGGVHHINLARLIGFCATKTKRLLVFEHVSNGSLDKWIFDETRRASLYWQKRLKIITDIAKGLCYLHEECRQRIAHFDIKPGNILLDDNFNAKVCDFGVSKMIDREKTPNVTRMRGTLGYLAPEWSTTSKINEKADVYSFGVVVMEILSGRKNLDPLQPEDSMLLRQLQDAAAEDRLIDMVDIGSGDMHLHAEDAVRLIKLSMWCMQRDRNKRPSMSMVLKVLEGAMEGETNLVYDFTYAISPEASDNINTTLPQLPSVLSGPR